MEEGRGIRIIGVRVSLMMVFLLMYVKIYVVKLERYK